MSPDDGGNGRMEPDQAGIGSSRTDAEPWRDLRISEEPERIKLGGKRVLSFADVGQIIEQEPRYSRRLDWNAIATSCGMTPLENRLFALHWRDGVPVYRLARRLGISQYEAGKLYHRIQIKLGINSQHIGGCLSVEANHDSLRPAYRDHLPSGRKSWSLTKLGSEFAAIMQAEKYIRVISERDPMEFQKSPRIWTPMNMSSIDELKRQLQTEQSKLPRIGELIHSSRLKVETDERVVDKLQAELRTEQANSILDGREFSPSPELKKKLVVAVNNSAHSRSELDAAIQAEQMQRQKIMDLEGQIAAMAHAASLDRTRDHRTAIRDGILELAKLLREYDALVSEDGQTQHWPEDLFPRDGLGPRDGSSILRGAMFQVVSAVAQVNANLWSLEQAKKAWAKTA